MLPESFAEDLMTEWSIWCLDHGLPELPGSVAVGESVPVARWVGSRFGAVLHVHWIWDDAHADDYLATEVQVFSRTADGWEESLGSGGTDWFDPPFVRPPSVGPRDAYAGHVHTSGNGWLCIAVDGLAGSDARLVEAADSLGVTRHRIECSFGAFVACWDGTEAATVRVLDDAGEVLFQRSFEGERS